MKRKDFQQKLPASHLTGLTPPPQIVLSHLVQVYHLLKWLHILDQAVLQKSQRDMNVSFDINFMQPEV